MSPRPSPFRRIGAFLIDYGVLAVWTAGVTWLSFASGYAQSASAETGADKIAGHAFSFAVLTLPVILYFSILEASPLKGTIGRRLAGLVVTDPAGERAGLGRALMRNIVKFLPWEIAHAAIWHQPGRPFVDAMPPLNMAICVLAIAAVLINLSMMWTPGGRTIHDRIAGSRVARA